MYDIVFGAEPDRDPATLSDVGILDRFVHIQIGQRVAIDVGPRVLEWDGALAFLLGVVAAERILAEGLEQVVERVILDAPHASGRDSPLTLAVLLDQTFLLNELDDLGHLLLELVHVAQDPLAVLHEVFGELIEDLVGRLGKELLRAIPLGIFKERHGRPLVDE